MAVFDRVETLTAVKPVVTLTSPGNSGMVQRPYQMNPSGTTYASGGIPPLQGWVDNEYTFGASGKKTVDLTDLEDLEGIALDGTGRSVQLLRMQCPVTNSNPVTLHRGETNSYELFTVDLSDVGLAVQPGGVQHMEFGNQLGAISAGAKNIKFEASEDDVLQYELVIG